MKLLSFINTILFYLFNGLGLIHRHDESARWIKERGDGPIRDKEDKRLKS